MEGFQERKAWEDDLKSLAYDPQEIGQGEEILLYLLSGFSEQEKDTWLKLITDILMQAHKSKRVSMAQSESAV